MTKFSCCRRAHRHYESIMLQIIAKVLLNPGNGITNGIVVLKNSSRVPLINNTKS
jgi:hypothetical protein